MAIQSTTTVGAPQASAAQAGSSASDISPDAFMKLLVVQLRNQDPLNPLDPKDTVTQLSQLTGVQQLVAIRDRMAALEIGTAGIANSQAADMVGRSVTASSDRIRLTANQPGNATYSIAERATSATATIRDASGEVVRTLDLGAVAPGTHTVLWDGLNAAGERAPAGQYDVAFSAENEAGADVAVSTEVTGIVSRIEFDNGAPELVIGDGRFLLGDVRSIAGTP